LENKIIILTDVELNDTDFHRDLFYTGMTRATESVRVLCRNGSQSTLAEWIVKGKVKI
jgi:ATP-dependent exoDNAse (exonuclease V) alpha subunit